MNEHENEQLSLQNQFLVALPTLKDSLFSGGLVFICQHDHSGSMGLIVNQKTNTSLKQILDHLSIPTQKMLDKHDNSVLAGGPIQQDSGFVIHRNRGAAWKNSFIVSPHISITTSKDILESIAQNHAPNNVVFALGCTGWEAGQLEQEIKDNFWLPLEANTDILFDLPPEQRLQAALGSIGISNMAQLSFLQGHA